MSRAGSENEQKLSEAESQTKEQLYGKLLEARRANREKNEFLKRMSHEIRTPMNSIIGLSYLTKEYVDDKKQVLENLDKITMSAHFLLSFIEDALNLSQIESGNIAEKRGRIRFETFLEGLCDVISERAAKKQIAFTAEKRGAFEAEYCFDAERLGKALYNLLENAVKFTAPEGHVAFGVELISETEQTAELRFTVTDDGVGIEKDFLPHVFEPFAKEDNRSTTLAGGAGLGLAVAWNIIDFMDGTLVASSEKGRGSVFFATVCVGKVTERRAAREQSGPENYDFAGKRVLLVEDNEINIEITRNLLLHKNFEVEVAVNGEEGVAAFLSHEPDYYDVILMDIRMPVMDGLAAAKEIRNSGREDGRVIPIVAMTANAFEEDVRKSFEAGMDAHLSKPVDVGRMYALLDNMLCVHGNAVL